MPKSSSSRNSFTATSQRPTRSAANARSSCSVDQPGRPRTAADSLLADAVRGRPGWSTLHELRAFAALRVGRCDVAVKEVLLRLDFGVERGEGPDLVMRCRRGLKL